MELHPFHRKLPVTQSHDDARAVRFSRFRADLELGRQAFFGHDERVISGRGHGLGRVAEERLAIVFDLAGFAVHKLMGPDHVTPECRANRLMSQADAQHRKLAGKVPDQINADAGLLRRTGAGRDNDAVRTHGFDLRRNDLVIAAHLYLLPQFSQLLHQVVGKGIVVIENEYHALPWQPV